LNFVAKAGAPPFAGELRSERQLGTLSVVVPAHQGGKQAWLT
jgi:hypothetical protein